jgi:diamine N-acetyltransferase
MINERFQGLGYGKKAMECVVRYIETILWGDANGYWLSYEPENVDSKALYAKFGFDENGEMCEEEIVAVCSIKA